MNPRPSHIDLAAANRLKYVREEVLNIGQAEMAKICLVTQAMISLMEKGKREINYIVLKRLYLDKGIIPTYIISGEHPVQIAKEKKNAKSEMNEIRAELEIVKARLSTN